ncbi:MAG: Fic family protein [Armatimonadota bacterium]
MKTYERTHPWLDFHLDISRADYSLWRALGEAQTSCEYIASMPLRPATAQMLYQIYLAKGAVATTSITTKGLTEEEALQHFEASAADCPEKAHLYRAIDNIAAASNDVLDKVLDGAQPVITVQDMMRLNSMILQDLELPDHVQGGQFRDQRVAVPDTLGAPAEDCSYLTDKLCGWLNSGNFYPPEGLSTVYGLLRAVVAHLYLTWIHPFGEGNGRTARLLEYQIMVSSGVTSPAAHLMSIHYSDTRDEYVRQILAALKEGGDILTFIEYAVQGFTQGLRDQIQFIHDKQWFVDWHNVDD